MVMSNCAAPPRARTSSTARAPAMPLPMTTSLVLGMLGFPCCTRQAVAFLKKLRKNVAG
jgi:hypothetical protein